MAATPSPWNFSSVRSQNDLNPRICSLFSLSNVHSFDTLLSSRAEPGGPLADRSTQLMDLLFEFGLRLRCRESRLQKRGSDASRHRTGLQSRFLRRFDSSKSVPGWTGRTQIRVTVPIKSRRGQVVKHHILWVTRLKPIIWQRLCTFCLVCGYGVGKEGKNRESETSLIQACSGSNEERRFLFDSLRLPPTQELRATGALQFGQSRSRFSSTLVTIFWRDSNSLS